MVNTPPDAARPPSRINGKINPEYQRYRAAKRAAEGLPSRKNKQTKEYAAEYRARRQAEGRPIKRDPEKAALWARSPAGKAAQARFRASEKGRAAESKKKKRKKKKVETADNYAARIIADLGRQEEWG